MKAIANAHPQVMSRLSGKTPQRLKHGRGDGQLFSRGQMTPSGNDAIGRTLMNAALLRPMLRLHRAFGAAIDGDAGAMPDAFRTLPQPVSPSQAFRQ